MAFRHTALRLKKHISQLPVFYIIATVATIARERGRRGEGSSGFIEKP
jgi:hypothetical protein